MSTGLTRRLSLVRACRFLLCHLSMGLYLEPEHEAEGEDYNCG